MSSTEDSVNERVIYSKELYIKIVEALPPYEDVRRKIIPLVIAGDPRLYMVLEALKLYDLAEICKKEAGMSKSTHQR